MTRNCEKSSALAGGSYKLDERDGSVELRNIEKSAMGEQIVGKNDREEG